MKKLKSIQLSLEHFPVPHSKENAQIALYLESIMAKTLSKKIHSIEIPSMRILSKFFDCPLMQIYDAMRTLQVGGYDYQFFSVDSNIKIWLSERRK